MSVKRFDYRKRVWSLGLFVLSMAVVGGSLAGTQKNQVSATLAGWNAANIISDYVMTDYNSMSEAQIQSFLKSKVNCNNTELWRRSTNKVTWSIKDGHFVCMADDKFNGETAAHIIRQAAVDYKINPKVLIVTLQKESSLITDSMPHSGQYKTAMGFGCPDTAACDSKYFGLKNQVRNAARFFRAYQDNASGWYKPYWTGTYKVHWHPDLSRCSGTNLKIQNRATASLYSYTPYQPNQTALNAGWGTGNSCSSYGNRNFYNYFTSWFGDTRKTGPITTTLNLPDGNYRLVVGANYNNDLQLLSASSSRSVNIVVATRKNSNVDSFYIQKLSDNSFQLINNFSKMCVDVPGANMLQGQEIKQWDKNTSNAQRFYIYDNEDGTYSLSPKTAPYLALRKNINGKMALAEYDKEDSDQKFRFVNISAPITSGFYNISSATNYNTRALDIKANGTKNKTNVDTWAKNFSKAQMWKVEYNFNTGYYNLSSISVSRSLDINGASKANKANAQLWDTHDRCAQQWYIMKSGTGYKLLNACSGKALDVNAGSTKNGANVQIWERNSSKAQEWRFANIGRVLADGDYEVASAGNTNYALDVTNNSANLRTNVRLYRRNGGKSQKFRFVYNNNTGFYRITHIDSGNSLTVANESKIPKTNVEMSSANNSEAQEWKVWRNNDGSYRITSACGGMVLDINAGKYKNNTNIQIWGPNNTAAQKWLIR